MDEFPTVLRSAPLRQFPRRIFKLVERTFGETVLGPPESGECAGEGRGGTLKRPRGPGPEGCAEERACSGLVEFAKIGIDACLYWSPVEQMCAECVDGADERSIEGLEGEFETV